LIEVTSMPVFWIERTAVSRPSPDPSRAPRRGAAVLDGGVGGALGGLLGGVGRALAAALEADRTRTTPTR
jgi:hypothetical protein